MRETPGSLRAYFILAGVIGAFAALSQIHDIASPSPLRAPLPTSWAVVIWIAIVARLAFGLGFVVAGVTLTTALESGAGWIKTMLLAAAAALVAQGILAAAVLPSELARGFLIGAGVAALICVYLFFNVRRLASGSLGSRPLAS